MAEFHARQAQPGDGNAVGTYSSATPTTQSATSSSVRHLGSDPATRAGNAAISTTLEEPLLEHDEPKRCPRSRSAVPRPLCGQPIYAETYGYDAHGNMTAMPHLTLMEWDFKRPVEGDLAAGGDDRNAGDDVVRLRRRRPARAQGDGRRTGASQGERIYLGGFEIYRDTTAAVQLPLERETLHVMDDKQRIALVETRTQGNDRARRRSSFAISSATTSARRCSSSMRGADHFLRGDTPFGTTSYQAVRSQTERRSATATRAWSATRRAGSTITARATTRRGSDDGRPPIRWASRTAQICMSMFAIARLGLLIPLERVRPTEECTPTATRRYPSTVPQSTLEQQPASEKKEPRLGGRQCHSSRGCFQPTKSRVGCRGESTCIWSL